MTLDKQAMIGRFTQIAVEMGVPQERADEAGLQCFNSMARMQQKHEKDSDRLYRKVQLSRPPRLGPEESVLTFLNGLDAATRDGAIRNNVRPYVALYERAQALPPESETPHDLKPIPVCMLRVAQNILGESHDRVRSVSPPADMGLGLKSYRYRLIDEGRMQDCDKLVLMVNAHGDYTASVLNPIGQEESRRLGNVDEFNRNPERRGIDQTPWKAAYFDPFVEAMVKAGFTDDNGRDYGGYGLPHFHDGQVTLAAWCYPPATESGLSDLSKIIVRGRYECGTAQDAFYFDSQETFSKALAKGLDYADRLLERSKQAIASQYVQPDATKVDQERGNAGVGKPADPEVCSAGMFSGPILSVEDGVFLQRVGRNGQTVKHAVANLNLVPAVGEVVDIRYTNGQGAVLDSVRGKELGHG